jgi:hypothetical protein
MSNSTKPNANECAETIMEKETAYHQKHNLTTEGWCFRVLAFDPDVLRLLEVEGSDSLSEGEAAAAKIIAFGDINGLHDWIEAQMKLGRVVRSAKAPPVRQEE